MSLEADAGLLLQVLEEQRLPLTKIACPLGETIELCMTHLEVWKVPRLQVSLARGRPSL